MAGMEALAKGLEERERVEDRMKRCCDELEDAIGRAAEALTACVKARIGECQVDGV